MYGGGGIMPDIFVSLDTTRVTDFYSKLIRQGVLNSFVLEYFDKNRDELKSKYPDFKMYNQNFVTDESMLQDLRDYGEENNVEATDEEFGKSKDDLKILLKALIARDIWDMSEYFQIMNTRDKGFNKAVEVIDQWNKYQKQVLNTP